MRKVHESFSKIELSKNTSVMASRYRMSLQTIINSQKFYVYCRERFYFFSGENVASGRQWCAHELKVYFIIEVGHWRNWALRAEYLYFIDMSCHVSSDDKRETAFLGQGLPLTATLVTKDITGGTITPSVQDRRGACLLSRRVTARLEVGEMRWSAASVVERARSCWSVYFQLRFIIWGGWEMSLIGRNIGHHALHLFPWLLWDCYFNKTKTHTCLISGRSVGQSALDHNNLAFSMLKAPWHLFSGLDKGLLLLKIQIFAMPDWKKWQAPFSFLACTLSKYSAISTFVVMIIFCR